MKANDAHSCSCFHKLDRISSLDRDQFHIPDNGCLSVWSVECSSWVVEASPVAAAWVVVEVGVAANPFEEQRCQERLVVGEPVVELIVGVVLAYGLEQLDEEEMTSFVQPLRIRIRRGKLHHLHLYLLHYASLLLHGWIR